MGANTESNLKICHVDMDAFYAAVEVRDNPELTGKPLIIGALPGERGVVATCSYEARKFGVRSAMSISEAYRRCPHGVFMPPSMRKYKEASDQIHKIWSSYTDLCEYVSLDECFLDVTNSEHLFDGASAIGRDIKRRIKEELDLTCSVGVGYSMMSAKLASEEKKPDGFFEILTPADLQNLIIDRSIRIIFGVGARTAEELARIGITTVRHIYDNPEGVISLLGNHGHQIIKLANGIDNRKVTPYADAKSLGTEHTFQQDISDFSYLRDVLRLTAEKLSFDIRRKNLYCQTVTIKITYPDLQNITRSKSGRATDQALDIYETAVEMFDKTEKRPIRLLGITLSNFTETSDLQLSLFDESKEFEQDKLDDTLMKLQLKYGRKIVKSASVLQAEKRIKND